MLGGYAETVRPCGAGTAATVRVELTFEGQTGRVSELRANGATPAIHRCVENIVKDARLRPFDTPRFRVTFPYRVR